MLELQTDVVGSAPVDDEENVRCEKSDLLVSLRTFNVVTIITLPESSDSFISQIRAASEHTITPIIVTSKSSIHNMHYEKWYTRPDTSGLYLHFNL